jgi:hypothetical protein
MKVAFFQLVKANAVVVGGAFAQVVVHAFFDNASLVLVIISLKSISFFGAPLFVLLHLVLD